MTKKQAVKLLPKGKTIHVFLNPGVGILLGADWDRKDVLALLAKATRIEETGEHSQRMGHGLAALEGNEWRFIETRKVVEVKP